MPSYDKFSYLFPPRPEKAIPKNFLGFYKKKGWVAQAKKNGTCNVLWVTPEKEIITRTRHETPHKAWTPTPKSSAAFKNLPGKGWFVFVTEVLHSKFEGVRDTHFVFDILVNDGEYLLGTTFQERMKILFDLFEVEGKPETETHYVVNENVWVAKLITGRFLSIWEAMNQRANEKAPENEGLVLKDPNATLKVCSKSKNADWMVKCRVASKNYDF